jgi:hypothetical protein
MAILGGGIRRLVAAAVLSTVWLGVCEGAPPAQADTLEDEIKAAFLYNFTKYVDWPTFAFRSAADPFRLCVIADDEFVHTIRLLIQGEQAGGRSLQLLSPGPSEVPLCQILFIGAPESARARAVLAAARDRPILTVGESPGFLDQGGIILFVVERSRVRFDVDLRAARHAGLTVSSKLLRVARNVHEVGQP